MQFRFADFVLDTDRRELTRQSEPVSLGPQVFDLLVYLVQNRERVVSKDDLFETVWQGRDLTDILNQRDGDYCIAVLRSRWSIVGDDVCGAGGR